ncbi:TonB-dependent siderophore receptor [Halarcobacter sp.]|uniref:TonB-dependent siderophore receptor n=1 Tax=Halarcobacter sp. TaxID=2321133 RepID=UPI003A8EC322
MKLLKSSLVAPSLALLLSVNLFAQESYTIKDKTLKEALEIISKKSKLSYIAKDKLLESRKVNDINDVRELEKALEELFAGTGLEAVLNKNTIIIKEKKSNTSSKESDDLGEVNVTESLQTKMANKNFSSDANLGLFGESNIKDVPMSVVTFTKDSIKNNQARQLSDLITQDSSVRSSGAYGDNAESFYLRGVPLGDWNQGEYAFDGIYGVAPNYKVPTDLFDAVSVVKGPSTILFGMSPKGNTGGAINLVPKRAYKDSNEIELRYTNDSRPGIATDISRRFGEDKQFGARLNLAYDNGDSVIDNLESEAFSGSLSLDYISDNFITSLDYISTFENIDAPFRRLYIADGVDLASAPDNDFNLAQDWEYSKADENLALYKFDYFFNEDTQVGFYLGGGQSDVDRLFQKGAVLQNSNGDVKTKFSKGTFDVSRFTYGIKANTSFKTGSLNHRINFDASSYEGKVKTRVNTDSTNYDSNIYNPTKISKVDLTLPDEKRTDTILESFAISDTISNEAEDIRFTFGGRYQNVESINYNTSGDKTSHYDDSRLSPFVGLVYKPLDDLSLYANYSQGLSAGQNAPSGSTNEGESLKPYKTTQIEVGAKYNYNNIDYSLALFDMERKKGESGADNTYASTMKLQHRGIEISAFGKLTETVRFSSALTYMKTKIKETEQTYANDEVGGAPELLANIGLDVDVPFVKGLSFGNYLIYSDEQYVRDGSTVKLPSWTRWDMGLKYETKYNGNDLTVMFDVDNVTNKAYYEGASQWGHISSGEPRVFSLSLNYKF